MWEMGKKPASLFTATYALRTLHRIGSEPFPSAFVSVCKKIAGQQLQNIFHLDGGRGGEGRKERGGGGGGRGGKSPIRRRNFRWSGKKMRKKLLFFSRVVIR